MSGPPEIALFFGRLHVLLLHLPIGLIALLALLEWIARSPRFRHANANTGLILVVAVPAAVLTAVCGWLLSLSGGYAPGLLQLHKWTGIATAAIFLLAGLLYRLDLKKPYRFCLFSSLAILIFASHFGGSLTHGSDYLVQYAPGPFRKWLAPSLTSKPAPGQSSDPANTVVFTSLVQPVLERNCVPCHGPEKTKAGLRLDSFESMLKGGENGPAIVPGNSKESLALRRVQLPPTSEDHMPPEGKPQPTASEIGLLVWWVDAGAPTNKTVAQLNPPPHIGRIVEAKLGATSRAVAAQPSAPPLPPENVLPIASTLADELGIVITPLAQNEPWLECNASIAGTNFSDLQLSRLAPLRANLRWLDLGRTAITDAALSQVGQMPNLTRLHLERTAITDDGLAALTPLAYLEYLNLYGTKVSDSGLQHLQRLPSLKQLYLWQTKVSAEAVTNFAQARIDTDQIARWEQEIDQLKAKIRGAQFMVDMGSATTPDIPTNALLSTNASLATNHPAKDAAALTALNAQCPVSGKPVDSKVTLAHGEKLIAFCCSDCRSQFQKDPKPYLAKLSSASRAETADAPGTQ